MSCSDLVRRTSGSSWLILDRRPLLLPLLLLLLLKELSSRVSSAGDGAPDLGGKDCESLSGGWGRIGLRDRACRFDDDEYDPRPRSPTIMDWTRRNSRFGDCISRLLRRFGGRVGLLDAGDCRERAFILLEELGSRVDDLERRSILSDEFFRVRSCGLLLLTLGPALPPPHSPDPQPLWL